MSIVCGEKKCIFFYISLDFLFKCHVLELLLFHLHFKLVLYQGNTCSRLFQENLKCFYFGGTQFLASLDVFSGKPQRNPPQFIAETSPDSKKDKERKTQKFVIHTRYKFILRCCYTWQLCMKLSNFVATQIGPLQDLVT